MEPEARAEAGEKITREKAIAALEHFEKTGALPPDVSLGQLARIARELREQRRKILPTPKKAREIAIQTGKHTLDNTGMYRPPVTKEEENRANECLRLLGMIRHLPELVKVRPSALLDQFAQYHFGDDLRRISLEEVIVWLVEFEKERAACYDGIR